MKGLTNRRRIIADVVNRNGFANVAELSEMLQVTAATIRSDLTFLEEKGVLKRSHGGAIANSREVTDLPEDVKASVNVSLKKRIAVKAATLVDENDFIIVACGSTMVRFAESLVPKGHLSVVTPSVRISMTLISKENVSVMQLGGMIHDNPLSTRGEYAEAGLDRVHCNKVFFGVDGVDFASGLTCSHIEEASLTKKMIDSSTQVIVLADSSKYCRRGFAKICPISEIDVLVTDSGMPKEAVEKLEQLGVKVVIA